MSTYVDIPHQLLNTIQAAFGSSVFKTYFVGDPWLFAKDSLPAIVVQEVSDDTDTDATGLDKVTHTIIVKLVFNKRDDFGASSTTDVTEEKIRGYVDGRVDASGGISIASMYSPQTIKGILRTNFSMGGEIVNQKLKTRYFLEHRPNELLTQQGTVTFTIDELVLVPNRT